jgi:hypothetical protein
VADGICMAVGEVAEAGAVYVEGCSEVLLYFEVSCLLRAVFILDSIFLPVLMAFSSRPSIAPSSALEAISKSVMRGGDCPMMGCVDSTKNDATLLPKNDQIC